MVKVLFVCLGNICRSPMAEGLFIKMMKENGWQDKVSCDSAGTGGWHAGATPDERMSLTARQHGIHLTSRARKLVPEDFHEFDFILAMDSSNYRDILNLQPEGSKAEIYLMRHWDKTNPGGSVPDPYYGGSQGFEEVYSILERSVSGFCHTLKKKHGL